MSNYYYKFSDFLKQKYGEKVWKISLDAGFSCPNCDESGKEGCIFCRNDSFSDMGSLENLSVREQMQRGIQLASFRFNIKKYLAYFQSSTNTFAPIKTLQEYYYAALDFEGVVGLSISTRPDCLSKNVLDLLNDVSQQTDLWVELGLQSSHNRTLNILNRGHTYEDYLGAVEKLQALNVRICTHIMIGLPGESRDDIRVTAERLAHIGMHEIKIHPMLVLKETTLENMYRNGEFADLKKADYIALTCDVLERLPKDMVIQRLTAEAPKEMLIAPQWALNKLAVINDINQELKKRQSRQGAKFYALQNVKLS